MSKHRSRRGVAGPLAAVAAAIVIAAPAQAQDADRSAEKTLVVSSTPERLGLPAGASARTIARTAIDRYAGRLGLRSTRDVAFAERLPVERFPGVSGRPRALVFEQRVDGVRVLWSRIVVRLDGRRVVGFTSVTVPS